MKAPAIVCIFLVLSVSDGCVVPRSGPFGNLPIFQQVTPEVVLDLAKSVSIKSACSLRAGEGERPPARWSRVGRLVGSHIGRTAETLVRRRGEKVMRVGWRRGFISRPCCGKHENLERIKIRRPSKGDIRGTVTTVLIWEGRWKDWECERLVTEVPAVF